MGTAFRTPQMPALQSHCGVWPWLFLGRPKNGPVQNPPTCRNTGSHFVFWYRSPSDGHSWNLEGQTRYALNFPNSFHTNFLKSKLIWGDKSHGRNTEPSRSNAGFCGARSSHQEPFPSHLRPQHRPGGGGAGRAGTHGAGRGLGCPALSRLHHNRCDAPSLQRRKQHLLCPGPRCARGRPGTSLGLWGSFEPVDVSPFREPSLTGR